MKEKLKKGARAKDYTRKLLQNCKSWGGPATSTEELKKSLQEKPDQQVTIVKTELAYHVHTHKAGKITRPHLFKQNGISYEEKLMNLSILLEDEGVSAYTLADLPTNSDIINTLEKTIIEKVSKTLFLTQEIKIIHFSRILIHFKNIKKTTATVIRMILKYSKMSEAKPECLT